MRLDVLSLGSTEPDPVTGTRRGTAEHVDDTLQIGPDHFGFGEHHAGRTVASSPPVVLSAITARTTRTVRCGARMRAGGSLRRLAVPGCAPAHPESKDPPTR
ncbi:LLM class flavin-dependent oxidoreductase [Saccharopolyspora gloriosae]|uniref:LLM class flavin-dependent oxidoreductase n=1 Tax=Saccharopolyspora gloriosae TaxID=455344 RepID=UPI001FB7AE9A|nr:LLM class flavin-dependent oxidoreductase [Saccharopolyspora gloriosae]